MAKITNKVLQEVKGNRYVVYSFDKDGLRALSYAGLDIVALTEEVIKKSRNNDILVLNHDEKDIKIITELEGSLKRRATKQEIVNFVNNDYML